MSENKNPVGRPPVNATPITVRVPPALLDRLDAWREKQRPITTRPEAIRNIMEAMLQILKKSG